MANIKSKKGTIGILTGGGDVPGLNPAIRAVTLRALNEGYKVIGLKRGWAGLIEIVRDKEADNSANYCHPDRGIRQKGRTDGRNVPSYLPHAPEPRPSVGRARPTFATPTAEKSNDLTPDVLKNLEFLGIDTLVPIGGDDTLSYGVHLHQAGIQGRRHPQDDGQRRARHGLLHRLFSTCVTRTIALIQRLRTSAGSHERFLVIEVFGRYAGFTALLPTLAGGGGPLRDPGASLRFRKAHRAHVPGPGGKSQPLFHRPRLGRGRCSKAATWFSATRKTDMFGHKKLGGIGDLVAQRLKELSPKYNNGRKVDVLNQKLGYLVRCGEPDALDAIIPMAFGNIAFDLILEGKSGPDGLPPQRRIRRHPAGGRDQPQESRRHRHVLRPRPPSAALFPFRPETVPADRRGLTRA